MAYSPQSVSLTQAGGDLDLLEALRGGRGRVKTQQEMLREQSMSPVEIGSYNGIQGKFPISQGINKIAQGLLATYMDSQARDRAQAAADAQKDEAQKYAAGFEGTPAVAGVDAVLPERGTVAGPVVDGVDPETPGAANFRIVMDKLRRDQPGQEGGDYRANAPVFGMPGQRMEAAPGQGDTNDPGVVGRDAVAAQPGTGLTQAQRTAKILQGMGSTNSLVNRMAMHLSDQDAKAEIARQHNELMGSNAALLAQSRSDVRDAATQRAKISADQKANAVPPAVLNQYTEQLGIYKTTARTVSQIDKNLERIDSGVLKFDLLNNASDRVRSVTGVNNEQSRAKEDYRNDVLRLANDVTQAAKGTQTEFDAKRAYDLIVGNLNDPIIVRTQLEKLRQIAEDSQNTAATAHNITVNAHPGLGQEPLPMAKSARDRAPPGEASASPAAAAEVTATNPQTGATLVLRNGAWVPAQ